MLEMRKRSGLSQKKVANRMGISSCTGLGNWENGRIEPTFYSFKKYAEACGYEIHVRRRDND